MSMSDCVECWSTPCECGLYWKDASTEVLAKHICSIVSKHPKLKKVEVLKLVTEMIANESTDKESKE